MSAWEEQTTSVNVLALAARYVEMRRGDAALEALARLDADDATSEWACVLRVSAHLIEERGDAAAAAARDGLRDHPDSSSLLYQLSVAEEQREDLAESERAILAALAIEPDRADFLTQYADLTMRAGQMDKAERLLARAGAADPDSLVVLQGRQRLAYLRSDDKQAERLSRELLAADPDNAAGHAMLGVVALQGGRAREASERFGEVVRGDPTNHGAADVARMAKRMTNPLRWPSRVVTRFGVAGTWVVAVGTIFGLRAAGLDTAAAVASVTWLLFCVTSWIFHER